MVATTVARSRPSGLIVLTSIAMLGIGMPLRSEAVSGSEYQLHLADPDAYRLQPDGDYKVMPGTAAPVSKRGVEPKPPAAAKRYSKTVDKVASETGVDPALIYAVMGVESSYNPEAVSPKGAVGLMQLMPSTARRYGMRSPETESKLPAKNIRAGAAYLRDLLEMFDNDVKLALAAYNAGENAVVRHGNKVPPYAETKRYLPKVLNLYDKIKPPQSPSKPDRVHKLYPPPRPQATIGNSADIAAGKR